MRGRGRDRLGGQQAVPCGGARAVARAGVRACGRACGRAGAHAGVRVCGASILKKEEPSYFDWKKSDNC